MLDDYLCPYLCRVDDGNRNGKMKFGGVALRLRARLT